MRIVHYGHACVLLETDSARILLDPGSFSTGFEGERELSAVFVTHQHFDHIDSEKLPGLLEANPGAKLIVDPGTEETVAKLGLEFEIARPGDSFDIAGTAVNAVGGEHAVIHQDLPQIPNVGFLFEHGAFYHPGDSFYVPEQKVDVLGLPTGAPWLKAGEAVDFLRAVSPRVAVPIHEAVLANPAMHYGLFTNLAPEGTEVRVAPRGEAAKL
ncbi:L-ascorbate metabolism protein UlaG (beta-lactamase superfamily) [Amycolatopsis bartoniae]|uniref:MBL fold metallo-hydrolase n=1 Tax=Amycolatopsis bartoniae TaxID=941986 RepID=A0A8H9J0Q2_9PSEU|nr:MBL fold metallo-hydrolase [Amycolatopsis bartoniae]MBB2933055.1 L-ascorbate metabolism protein UlaG (beta-lactamase superfamily) [Amycolatopsis bartoniae]TVT11932.1 MBL fold metallo-hydrolase [Amycolatopsis bartoniae]GHF56711.1 MBL fold metallo-hydrolase [Amycolatopsis bartoniae]